MWLTSSGASPPRSFSSCATIVNGLSGSIGDPAGPTWRARKIGAPELRALSIRVFTVSNNSSPF
jgi:hypothetical protein